MAASKAWATRSSSTSPPGLATICTPTGRPEAEKPAGTEIAGQPVAVGLTLAGLGFGPSLWWGPGADRLRETVRRGVDRTSRTELWGWFVAGTCFLGAAALLAVLFRSGANWAPGLHAPWR